ncbi:hypothetical protein PISMIDRAFT_677175 [Pisolithus microcarpus 441]|uniref:Uncharacterized protein n=1 Tax=Pisolithus microcarpus 441 TaxID=765257 RepID=A0A0C9ZTG7_9AGAM|nr:hypothetical protein PISMIDRAFT_677175 [Pisolithus microcarpus 441]
MHDPSTTGWPTNTRRTPRIPSGIDKIVNHIRPLAVPNVVRAYIFDDLDPQRCVYLIDKPLPHRSAIIIVRGKPSNLASTTVSRKNIAITICHSQTERTKNLCVVGDCRRTPGLCNPSRRAVFEYRRRIQDAL